MKKLLNYFIVLLVLVGLVACSTDKKDPDPVEKEVTCEEDPTQDKCITCEVDPKQEKCYDNHYYGNTLGDFENYVTIPREGELKILQMSDIHFHSSSDGDTTAYANPKVTETKTFITNLIEKVNPTLIVLTGDVFYDVAPNSSVVKNFISFMDEFKISWMYMFGNHDAYTLANKKTLSKQINQSTYGIFTNELDTEERYGNYTVTIREEDNYKLLGSLFVLDSGIYSGKYESINEAQIQWYETRVNELNTLYQSQEKNPKDVIPSIVFQHIPLQQYKKAFDESKKITSTIASLLYGVRGETECPGATEYGFFDKIVELKSTMGMFCGHDHANDYAVNYQGVVLAYGGQTGDCNSYTKPQSYMEATLITLDYYMNMTSKLITQKDVRA